MFGVIERIDKAIETKQKCTVIDKMGKFLHGTITDSWVRVSGAKMRGKITLASDERGTVEIDANDIADVLLPK